MVVGPYNGVTYTKHTVGINRATLLKFTSDSQKSTSISVMQAEWETTLPKTYFQKKCLICYIQPTRLLLYFRTSEHIDQISLHVQRRTFSTITYILHKITGVCNWNDIWLNHNVAYRQVYTMHEKKIIKSNGKSLTCAKMHVLQEIL